MKGQNRKILQAVMKSPSPDIAHRSIIANTKSPVNQIKQYIKMRQSSTSPKSMTTSFHHIAKSFSSENQEINRLKKYIEELEQKLKYLQKIHISHDQIAIINQDLNNQIAQLRMQLRQERQRSRSNASKNFSPHQVKPISPKNGGKGVSLVRNSVLNTNPEIQNIPQPSQNDQILRQFNERIMKMSEQNKRLTQKLNQVKDEKDCLQKQNSLLQLKGSSQTMPNLVGPIQTQAVKRYFAEQANRIVIYYEGLNEDRIEKLRVRVDDVEMEMNKVNQRQNQKKVYTRNNTPYELKANLSMDTNFRSENQDDGPLSLPANKYNFIESKYTTSPSQFKTFTHETSPIRFLEEEKDKVKKQNEYLKRKTDQLQKQLKNALIANHDLQRKIKKLQTSHPIDTQDKKNMYDSNFSLYKSLQQKCQHLETQLGKKNAQINCNQTQIHQLLHNLSRIKELNDVMSKDLEKNLDQQKQKNQRILADNQQLRLQIVFFEEKYLPKEQYFVLEREIKQLKEVYRRYKIDFQRYLKMLQEIRSSITSEGLDQSLNEIESKWQVYDELEIQIKTIYDSYEASINNMKKKLLQKEQTIAQLQKDNQILFQSNEQTKNQLFKLQMAISEYRQPVKSVISEEEIKRRVVVHQSATKPRERCQIRDYINKTVAKINCLENQIQNAVNSGFSETKMATSMKYFQKVVGPYSSQKPEERLNKYKLGHNGGEKDRQAVEDEQSYIPVQ